MAAADSDMRLIIAGAGGRMGRTLLHAIGATKGVTLAGAVEAADSAVIGRDAGELAGLGPNGVKVASDVAPLLKAADGVIEFSTPAATLVLAELCASAGIVHVIGTTGHSAEQEAAIVMAAGRVPIVKSGNMSLGVNLLAALVKRVAQTLDDAYDIEILEMHHSKKVDAPSGTALMLGNAAAAGRGIDLAQHSLRGRDGLTGTRTPGAIGFASLRGRRSHRDFRRSRRAYRAHASRRGSHDLRARRVACGLVGARQDARPLFDGGCAGAGGYLTHAVILRWPRSGPRRMRLSPFEACCARTSGCRNVEGQTNE
jgi:4-hydroxy-tetrahydrodipicolinate reductase